MIGVEFRRAHHVGGAWAGQIDLDHIDDAAGARAHHRDHVGKEDSFGDAVRGPIRTMMAFLLGFFALVVCAFVVMSVVLSGVSRARR